MKTTPNINYQQFTKLPLSVRTKAENLGSVISVKTPHKGEVFIELTTIDRGIFRPAKRVEVQLDYITNELAKLDYEAKEYLMDKWLAL